MAHAPVSHVVASLEPTVAGRSGYLIGRWNREKHRREGVLVVCSRSPRMLSHPERAHQRIRACRIAGSSLERTNLENGEACNASSATKEQ